MFYFSYGSNMSSKRLGLRVPSAKSHAAAILQNHQLKWHKRGLDSSAKCDVEYSENNSHFVIGVVFKILPDHKVLLDAYEGLGKGYEVKQISVKDREGNLFDAFTYYATDIDKSLSVYHWYKQHVLVGAREHDLPNEYITKIENINTIDDLDSERHIREISIYHNL